MRLLRYIFIYLLIYILMSCSQESSDSFIPTKIPISHIHNFYKDFEEFDYEASLGVMHVGDLKIGTYISKDGSHYLAFAKARLKGLAGGVSGLNDYWETQIDTTSLLPIKFSQILKENKYIKNDFTTFDRKEGKATVTDTSEGRKIVKTYSMTPEAQDMISSFFLLRNIDFKYLSIGDTIGLDIFFENTMHNIKLQYLGKEKAKSKSNKIGSYIIAPLLPNIGVLMGEHPIRAYISDNERKIPMKVIVKSWLGTFHLKLKKYETN